LPEARRRAEHHRRLADAGVRITSTLAPAAALTAASKRSASCSTHGSRSTPPRHRDRAARVRWLLERHAGVIADVRLRDLTKQHITLAVLPLVARRQHKTAADLFTLLRQVTAFAARHDFLTADPSAAMKRSDLVPPAQCAARAGAVGGGTEGPRGALLDRPQGGPHRARVRGADRVADCAGSGVGAARDGQ
jgi:hypothetical protein